MTIHPAQLPGFFSRSGGSGAAGGSSQSTPSVDFASLLQNRLKTGKAGASADSPKGAAQGTTEISGPLSGFLSKAQNRSILTAGKTIEVPEIRRRTQELIQKFHKQFNQLLQQNDIDPAGGIHLQMGETGDLEVTNNHPDQMLIESLLSEQTDMKNLYRAIQANAAMLRNIEETAAFQNQYSEDPFSAVSNFSHLFSQNPAGKMGKFDLYVDRENVEVSFL